MAENTKRAVAYSVFALGLILGLLGWVGDVYASTTGTILFIVCIVIAEALRILWGIRK